VSEQDKGYIPSLDGWRMLAILGVMIAHASDALVEPGSVSHALTRQGAFGVDVFFGISGYLITMRLLDEGAIDLKRFYVRRAFRILPPYFAYLVATGVLALLGVLAIQGRDFVSCLLFYRNYLSPSEAGSWWTAHFWSLAVEEHFYVIWPTLLAVAGVRRAPRVAAGLALGIAGWRSFEFRCRLLDGVLPGVSFFERSDVRLDGLLWGCLAALLVREHPEQAKRLATTPILAGLLALFAACVWGQTPLALLFRAVLIPAMLVSTSTATTLATRALELAPVRWVGRLSYSLYVWQTLFLVGRDVPTPLGALQAFPLNVLATFACATASYYAIERPLLRLGHRLAPR
jgi:peptidoglycan/LPS O-acetylase OafA/YrhL